MTRKDYSATTYYRSPLAVGLEPIGYAILATLALAVLGVILTVAMGDPRDPTARRVVLLAMGLPWFILAWGQVRRLLRRQVRDLAALEVHPTPRAPLVDVTPWAGDRLALPEPWATSEPEPITDADLAAFTARMFQQQTWSKRAARNWRLPSGWCSESAWQSAMERLEAAGILGPYVNGRTRQLLVADVDEALALLGLGPAETGEERRSAVDVSKAFEVRWVFGEGGSDADD